MADFNRCISALNKAAGRELTADEIQEAFGKLQRTAKDIAAGRVKPAGGHVANTPDGLIRQAAEIEAQAMVKEAQRKLANAERDIEIRATQTANIEAMKASGIDEVDAVRRLIVNDADGRANQFSLEAREKGISVELRRGVIDTWAAMDKSFMDYLQRADKVKLLLEEIRGKDTGDALAKQGAKSWKDTAEKARLWFNERGGKIGHLEDWGLPQHHSQEMVARAGRDAWVADVFDRLDRSRYTDIAGNPMTDGEVRAFLGSAWETIATNGATKIEPGKPRGKGAKANRHAEERQIHFKDADSTIEYWAKFGEKTVPDIMLGHLETMARDIAFIEHFGSNPSATYTLLRDTAEKSAKLAAPTKTDKIDRSLRKMDIVFDYAAGNTKPTVDRRISGAFDVLRNLNTAGKLGSAMWPSLIGDKVMFEAMSHLNNLPAVQRWSNELRMLNPANAQERRLLRRQGLMLDYMTQAMYRFGDELGKSSLTGKLANGVMRVTGMAAVNEWRRGAFALSAMDAIGHVVSKKDFANVGKDDMRLLGSYGITDADWRVWKLAKLEDLGHGNDTGLTPEAVGRIPDADMLTALPEVAQRVKEKIAAQTAELSARNAQDQIWIRGRLDKFDDARDALNRTVRDRAGKRFAANERATGPMLERMSLLDAQREQAQLQADMEADFNRLATQDDVRSFLNAVEDGASADKTDVGAAKPVVRGGLESAEAIGRRYGVQKGRLERRMVEIENRITAMDREAGSAANADAKAAQKKAEAMAGDLREFIKRSQDRQQRRQHVIDRLMSGEDAGISTALNAARRDATVKLLGALTSESHMAVIEPGWEQRAKMYGGLQRGVMRDELTRSFWQFKSFPLAQFQQMIDIGMSRPTTGGKIGYLSAMPVAMTLAGAMMIQVQEMLAGKDPRPMADWKFWVAAFLKGGSLGIYGDFMFSGGQTRMGSGPLEVVAGPTIGLLADIANLAAKAKTDAEKGEGDKSAARAISIAKGLVPGQNVWMTKAATDRLLFQNVQEALNPGYLQSMQDRSEREYGNESWWKPGEMVPDRPPNLGRAFESR